MVVGSLRAAAIATRFSDARTGFREGATVAACQNSLRPPTWVSFKEINSIAFGRASGIASLFQCVYRILHARNTMLAQLAWRCFPPCSERELMMKISTALESL